MNKRKLKLLILDLLFFVLLVGIDQVTKYYAVLKLKNQSVYTVIEGILDFNYLENRGAAFGILQNQSFFFITSSIILLFVFVYILFKIPEYPKVSTTIGDSNETSSNESHTVADKKSSRRRFTFLNKQKYSLLHMIIIAIIAGGVVGNNLIDRLFLGYVIDFIDVTFIDFPIFNMADSYVCVAVFVFAILVLFVFEDDDLDFVFK